MSEKMREEMTPERIKALRGVLGLPPAPPPYGAALDPYARGGIFFAGGKALGEHALPGIFFVGWKKKGEKLDNERGVGRMGV